MIKKCFALLCALFAFTGAMNAQDPDPTNYFISATFPDPFFRRWVQEQPFGSDGFLSYSERMSVTSIDLSSSTLGGIKSLEGIELFENLNTLNFSGTQVSSFDASALPKLRFLYCSNTPLLTSVDLSSCSNFGVFECNSSQLASLTLPSNANSTNQFEYLSCQKTKLTSLHLTNNTYSNVRLSHSPISSLTFGSDVAIEKLYCDSTYLTSLSIPASSNAKLLTVDCSGSRISSLDLSGKKRLAYLYCQDNELTTLDVTENTSLLKLKCWGNHLTTLDLSNNPDAQLEVPSAVENYVSETASLPIYFKSGQSQVQLKDGYVHGTVSNLFIYFADGTYQSKPSPTLLTTGWLMLWPVQKEITRLKYDFVPKSGAKTMKVEVAASEYGNPIVYDNFPDANFRAYLKAQPYGTDNMITPDELPSITTINVHGKHISDLTGIELFTSLTELDCAMNSLTTLNVSALTQLTKLNCWSNQLTSLNLLDLDNLEWLAADDNALTTLVLPRNSSLSYVNVSSNQLTSLNLYSQTTLDNLHCDNNALTSLDLSRCTRLTQLYCSGNDLTSLDLSALTALEHLYCQDNALTSLDLSANTALKYLYCNDNTLAALDLTANPLLLVLYCHNNQIKGTAMRALVQSMPDNSVSKTMRVYYQGSDTEGNEMSPAMVNYLTDRHWAVKYYDTSAWSDYTGGTATYNLWVAGQQVTSANANDVMGDGRRRVAFKEMDNRLELRSAIISCSGVGLRNTLPGLDILLVGSSRITSSSNVALQVSVNTSITGYEGTGKLFAMGNTNGVLISSGTLTVRDGATLVGDASQATPEMGINSTSGCGICGEMRTRTTISGTTVTYLGTLALQGIGTEVKAQGTLASIGPLKALNMTGFKFTSPANARWNASQHCVYAGNSLATDLVTIEYNYKQGDVNGDDEVDLSDAIMVTYYSLHQTPAKFNEAVADMNGDGQIDLSDAIVIIYKSLGVK